MTRLVVSWSLALAVTHAGAATTFVVAPQGNDAWSGRVPEPNAPRTDGPFASVTRARDAVREAKANGEVGPFVVELRGGTHALTEPLVFTPEDSGTAEAPVVYRAHAAEQPILSGGRTLSGFAAATLNGVACWRAEVPEVKTGWAFRQLFVKRQDQKHFSRRYRPVKGMLAVAGLTYSPARKTMSHRAAQPDFEFFPGDFQQWENLADVEVVALHSWSASRLFVERLDLAGRIVTFTAVPTFRIGHWYAGERNPYFVENVKEELRRPGEWYLDRPTASLYYVPLLGETPETVTVVAPLLEKLVEIRGDAAAGRFVEHLRFERLTFSDVEWVLPRTGYDVSQGQPTLPAALEFSGARGCVLDRCTVAHVGGYAVGLGLGCHENRIGGCLLFDLGGGGVKVGDSRMERTKSYPDLPTGNVVEDNVIAGGGLISFSANGIWAGIVKGTVIRRNEVRDFPHSGIAVGWCWGYGATTAADNAIVGNHIHHVMKLLQDGGGIYTLGQQPGTVIRRNVIHDCLKGPFACDAGQLGIYLDEGSGPFLISENLVYRVQMGAFNQHYGRENTVENNVFAFAAEDPITCARQEDHLSFTFRRNIVCQSTGSVISGRYNPRKPNTRFEGNLYFDTSVAEPRFGDLSFQEWQATGRDRDSIIADPLFVSAAQDDFRLKPDSPALKLGFVPLDPAQAGLEPAYREVDDPSAEVRPPPVYGLELAPLPPPVAGFNIDCEKVPVGVCPRELTRAGCFGDQGDFVVTDEVARYGRRCLKGFEHEGLAKSFYPYLVYQMHGQKVERGKVTFRFAFRNHPQTPGHLVVEFRDYANRGAREFLTGPLVEFTADGTVTADQTRLAALPAGEWCEAQVRFELGPNAPKTYAVTITPAAGAPVTVSVPYRHQDFAVATWLGIVSAGTNTAAFYLDDLRLTVE